MKMSPPALDELGNLKNDQTLDEQITFIHDQFGTLGKYLNLFIFKNYEYTTSERMKNRSMGLISDFVDIFWDFERFFQVIA